MSRRARCLPAELIGSKFQLAYLAELASCKMGRTALMGTAGATGLWAALQFTSDGERDVVGQLQPRDAAAVAAQRRSDPHP